MWLRIVCKICFRIVWNWTMSKQDTRWNMSVQSCSSSCEACDSFDWLNPASECLILYPFSFNFNQLRFSFLFFFFVKRLLPHIKVTEKSVWTMHMHTHYVLPLERSTTCQIVYVTDWQWVSESGTVSAPRLDKSEWVEYVPSHRWQIWILSVHLKYCDSQPVIGSQSQTHSCWSWLRHCCQVETLKSQQKQKGVTKRVQSVYHIHFYAIDRKK